MQPDLSSDDLTHRLDDLLQDLVSRKDVRHAIVAVESTDRSVSWMGAAGEATPDGAPMQPDTPYFIASIDKLLTATVVLKLRERGCVTLQEPISTYLPDSLIGGIHRLGGADYTGRITVRHLLSHTSGLPDWLEDCPRGERSMVERLIEDGDCSVSVNEMLEIVRDRLTPHFPPQPEEAGRQKVRYSDTNYILLVAIIEAATGQPLHQVHEELLFRPFALRRTWIAGHSEPAEQSPQPATLWADDAPLEIPQMIRSFWGIYSTTDDMLKFLRAFTSGLVFDDPSTFTSMQQRWNRFGIPLDRAALRAPQWPIEYGLGIMRFHDPIRRLFSRLPRMVRPAYPAPAVIGHSGSTGSWLFYCPKLDLLLSGTVDQVTAGIVPYRLVPKILRIVDSAIEDAQERRHRR